MTPDFLYKFILEFYGLRYITSRSNLFLIYYPKRQSFDIYYKYPKNVCNIKYFY